MLLNFVVCVMIQPKQVSPLKPQSVLRNITCTWYTVVYLKRGSTSPVQKGSTMLHMSNTIWDVYVHDIFKIIVYFYIFKLYITTPTERRRLCSCMYMTLYRSFCKIQTSFFYYFRIYGFMSCWNHKHAIIKCMRTCIFILVLLQYCNKWTILQDVMPFNCKFVKSDYNNGINWCIFSVQIKCN